MTFSLIVCEGEGCGREERLPHAVAPRAHALTWMRWAVLTVDGFSHDYCPACAQELGL